MSSAVDLVSSAVAQHHNHVAYMACEIASELGLSDEDQAEVLIAGALHDTGALTLKDRIDALEFDVENPHLHAELGYRHLRTFPPLYNVARLVRYHHVAWENGEGKSFHGKTVPVGCHILQLADRVDTLIDRSMGLESQVVGIIDRVSSRSGIKFMPDVVKAFVSVTKKGGFWSEVSSGRISDTLKRKSCGLDFKLDMEGLHGIARLFSNIIDFRSRFTSIHSSGVSACAYMLAGTMGMSREDCNNIIVAGLLHDLGKLAVPTEILEKNGPLDEYEAEIIRAHPRHTYETLKSISRIETINRWASHHHERIDGNGYPFGLSGEELDMGSKIVAVSDIFTALKEDRPYRPGMDAEQVLGILAGMADDGALDHDVVDVVHKYHDQLDLMRIKAQDDARRAFKEFCRDDC